MGCCVVCDWCCCYDIGEWCISSQVCIVAVLSRASLDVQVAERVVNAIFTSRLDYCNSLLAGLTAQDFTRMQRLQNAAARCILMRPRDFSATDMLCEMHRLPVRNEYIINCCYSLTKLLMVQPLNTW